MDAKAVRDALLTQHFGYAPADIEPFVAKSGFYVAEKGKPGREATRKEVASWRRDALGRVPVHLADFWIEEIRNFRRQLVLEALGKAASSILDPTLRAAFVTMMQRVITESGEARATVFLELMNAMNASGAPRGQFVAAFEALRSSSLGGNPYIDLAQANLALEDAKTLSGPGYDTVALGRLREALRKLEASELGDGAGGSLTRADAELINSQAARIQGDLGDEDGANRREWIARFMGMSDAERSEYVEGDIVELIEPGVYTMSAPNATSRKLSALEEEWAKRQRFEQEINRIGAPTAPNVPGDDKLFNQGTETVTINGVVRRKKRGTGGGYQSRYRVSSVDVPLRNPGAVTTMKGGLAAVEIFNTAGKIIAADRRMRELADYLAKKEQLQSRLRNQSYRAIPPQPAKIKAVLDQLVALDASTTDVRRKQEIQKTISDLRALLEESRAAWPGK